MVYNKLTGVPTNALYVGRGSVWGNPFVIGVDGDRETVIERYRKLLWSRLKSGEIVISQLASLHGRPLYSYPGMVECHGDVLVRAAAWAWKQPHDIFSKEV